MQPRALLREAAEDDVGKRWGLGQRLGYRSDRDGRGPIGGKTIDAGRNGGKSDRSKAARLTQFDRAAIAGRERFIFAALAPTPDRSNGMNHMPRGQPVAAGDLGIAGRAAAELAAFRQQLGAGGTMNGAVNAAPAEQRRIGGVHYGINAQGRNVGDNDLQSCVTQPTRQYAQAEAGAPTTMPFSAKSCCNSPAWNISRTMSQPPTNSPFT